MRTVITISLNGNAYQLDAVGYEALRAYLQVAEQRLAGNPDQAEILADLEQAIADKCRRYLGPHKNVVSSEEVAEVLGEMGPVDGGAGESVQAARAGSMGGGAMGAEGLYAGAGGATGAAQNSAMGDAGAGAQGDTAGGYGQAAADGPGSRGTGNGTSSYGAGTPGASSGGAGIGGTGNTANAGVGSSNTGGASGEAPRRLYQIREGAVISGVCKGLAAYLNIDVAIIRILFVALVILTGGVWILVYVVMMFVIPYAQTSEQHAAAHGLPFNAEELVARAKAHYAQFREHGVKWQRKAYREQRRMWRSQHKQWKEHQRAWERWGGLSGNPPPPPPPPPPGWAGQQPPNPNYSYSSQLLNGVLSPIVGFLGVILFFTFLWTLIEMVKHHTFFGWWLPHDIPLWVGIVFLIVLYRVIASPLNQARYAAYHGAPVGHAWVALVGALVWLALVLFLGWLAWQHWDEVLDFLQGLPNFFRDTFNTRSVPSGDWQTAGFYFLAWGVPSCVLPGYIASREFDSHGEVDGADVLGEAADGDIVDSGFGDGTYVVERYAA
jgi:phage shock protein PspC (stress-responsive transcriptional regulator)